MQAAELAWWTQYMGSRTAVPRMLALYGARYHDFFFQEFEAGGRVVEYGSGPLPVMLTTRANEMLAVDTLYSAYIEAGLTTDWIPWFNSAGEVPDGYFDTALLLNVLDHTDDPETLIANARRSLAPGGKALVFVHLEQSDEKHKLVMLADVRRWFEDWELERCEVKTAAYDPDAYMAVYRA